MEWYHALMLAQLTILCYEDADGIFQKVLYPLAAICWLVSVPLLAFDIWSAQ